MGGDGLADADERSPITEQASVGDWRLPAWMPRISGLAWLFIGLAIVAFVGQVLTYEPGFGWTTSFQPGTVFAAVGKSVPIIIPAAVLWRVDPPRPRVTGPLALGSIAIAVGSILTGLFTWTGGTFHTIFGDPTSDAWQDNGLGPDFVVPQIVAIVLAVAGPVLLGVAIRGLRDRAAPRWQIRAAVLVGGLTVADLAFTLNYALDLYRANLIDPTRSPGGLEFFGAGATIGLVGTMSFVGWAIFAWTVITATGAGTRPRRAWLMAVLAVVIQQGLVALGLGAEVFAFVTSPLNEPSPISEVAVAIYLAVFLATPMLSLAASVLLVVAFAAGFGRGSEQVDHADEMGDGLLELASPSSSGA